jgi:hypothetical protein
VKPRIAIATALLFAIGVVLIFASVATERRIPPRSTFARYEYRIYASVGRDRTARPNREIIMPEAFSPESDDWITISVESRLNEPDTVLDIPVTVNVRCGVGLLLFGKGGGRPIPISTDIRDRIVDRLYATHSEMSVVPRSCFTATTMPTVGSANAFGVHSIPLIAGRTAVALRIASYTMFAIAVVLGLWLAADSFRREWRRQTKRCASCGYSLAGLDVGCVCPECGKHGPS